MNFLWKKSICPKDFHEALSFFKMHSEGAVLLNIKWPRSGHKLMAGTINRSELFFR